ncbi:hypothetical protein Q0590_36375 [Rhodocytophaga aerolata]|uniref:Tetratricopeptide repeat protein n=1 Tax=Rhodocytophaga aerolata TaxID=455078 RepID=A0ABT8RCW2_9BACT|nr:hypothetical protein [Rhodocytophaga aerolata]MDO1449169.1 hypothetical protein [Rhodocytophaga aerolata]MDO1451808.1 hypothetical protein [Rhodocytophaga aerolata]
MQLFEDALAIEKLNPDVAREASIAAIDAGHVELAVNYSLEAIKRLPTDSGLMCNHAINLMVAGKDKEALEWIEKALAIDPMDKINQNAHQLIKLVSEGKRKRPKFDELM